MLLTVVPSFKSVMSSVVPAGTAMPLRIIVLQLPLPDSAELASVNVHPDAALADTTLAELVPAAVAATEEELPES